MLLALQPHQPPFKPSPNYRGIEVCSRTAVGAASSSCTTLSVDEHYGSLTRQRDLKSTRTSRLLETLRHAPDKGLLPHTFMTHVVHGVYLDPRARSAALHFKYYSTPKYYCSQLVRGNGDGQMRPNVKTFLERPSMVRYRTVRGTTKLAIA